MISYEKFWQTLKAKNISQYKLSVYYGVSNSQINRIKKGQHISTSTIENLCRILDCRVEDIITYIPGKAAAKSSIALDAVAEQEESAYENKSNKA
ncbi:MAG: helix-turn-helix domain-containing protein [Catonella sp.]